MGLVGAGSMSPGLLALQLEKLEGTQGVVGVNVPLFGRHAEEQLRIALGAGVRVFFTSAGSPKRWTAMLQAEGARVFHVVSSPDQAHKCAEAGCDGVVLEGFEAGGHNGRAELTTLVLLQQVQGLGIPVVAAGGIGSGAAILAALALGADGVQLGTLFACTQESSAHPSFKQACVEAGPQSTFLRLKRVTPVRLLHNPFAQAVAQMEDSGATAFALAEFLGKGRARAGILDGDLTEGELEIGQIVSEVQGIPLTSELVERLVGEVEAARERLFSGGP